MAVDIREGSGQLVIVAILVYDSLDLRRAELSVGEHCLIWCEAAEDAVAAENHNAVVVLLHGIEELVAGRLILEEFGLVL